MKALAILALLLACGGDRAPSERDAGDPAEVPAAGEDVDADVDADVASVEAGATEIDAGVPDTGAAAEVSAPDAFGPVSGCAPGGRRISHPFFGGNDLALDDTDLFVARDGGVMRLRKTGGDMVPVTNAKVAFEVVVDARDLFVISDFPTRLARVPRAGGDAVAISSDRSWDLQHDETHIYFAQASANATRTVVKADKETLTARPIVVAHSFLLDRDALFYNLDGITYRATRDGTNPRALATRWRYLVAADEAYVYGVAGFMDLERVRKDGGQAESVAKLPTYPEIKEEELVFALDGAHLYLADTTGAVRRLPSAGGSWTTLAAGLRWHHDDAPPIIAIDNDSVYFQAAIQERTLERDTMVLFSVCK